MASWHTLVEWHAASNEDVPHPGKAHTRRECWGQWHSNASHVRCSHVLPPLPNFGPSSTAMRQHACIGLRCPSAAQGAWACSDHSKIAEWGE
jgi:hypothetical protein